MTHHHCWFWDEVSRWKLGAVEGLLRWHASPPAVGTHEGHSNQGMTRHDTELVPFSCLRKLWNAAIQPETVAADEFKKLPGQECVVNETQCGEELAGPCQRRAHLTAVEACLEQKYWLRAGMCGPNPQ